MERLKREPVIGPDPRWIIPRFWDSSLHFRAQHPPKRADAQQQQPAACAVSQDALSADQNAEDHDADDQDADDQDADDQDAGNHWQDADDNPALGFRFPGDDDDDEDSSNERDTDDDNDGDSEAERDAADDIQAPVDFASESTVSVVIDDEISNEVQGPHLPGAQALAVFLNECHADLDASRREHLEETYKLHNLSVLGVGLCAELGVSMLAFHTLFKTFTGVLDEVLVEVMQKKLCTSRGVAMIGKLMRHYPLNKVRDSLCSAAKGYLGRVFAFVFSMRGICENVPGSSPTHTVRLRDPIVLIHDMLNNPDVLAPGEQLHIFAKLKPAVLEEFNDGSRFLEMQNLVRERARRAAETDPTTWAGVDIDDELAALPIGVYMDATHATKTGSVVKCPIVVFTYWHSRDTLQRDGAKRILGYAELPAKGRQTNWRAAFERAKEQCVLEAVFHLISAWQNVAFRRGGLVFKVAKGRQVRAVPVLAAILGDNKESNRLSCTFETTRCRICSADRAAFRNGMAMPVQPTRDLETLREHWKHCPVPAKQGKSVATACSSEDFGSNFGIHSYHAGARNALFTTTMDFFAMPTSIYPMLPYDRLHTLWKGPVSELVVAVLCSAQRTRKTFISHVKLCQGGIPPVLTVTTERLQNYLAAAGRYYADALQRPKFNAKDYVRLMRGVLSGYIHDVLVGRAAKREKLSLQDEFRVLIWALAAAARVCHEFARQRIAVAALPALQRDVETLVALQQRYRIIFEQTNVTSLKAHGLLHMVVQIALFGPLDLTDTASLEHHHLKVARLAKLVDHGIDVADAWMLRRAIEHEAAQNRPGLPVGPLPDRKSVV